mgnify:CR=1 FL=1
MGIKKRNILLTLLAGVGAAALVLALVLNYVLAFAAAGDRNDVVSTVSSISPGVTETEYYTQNTANTDQVVSYSITVDMSQNTLIAGYGNYDTSGKWSLVNVRNQAAAAERSRGVNVVAAVNGDFFNMATGEPTGTLVMNGIHIKDTAYTQSRTWFAVDAENNAYIGTGALPENTVEAIGGDLMLIKDGAIALGENSTYYTTKQPRTAVGVTAGGDVVIVVADGRQSPYSSGYTYMELAEKMLKLGCVAAINLDGGGSTTYLAQYSGTDELVLANSPSDGREREVSSSLMVVSNSEETGVFGSASISPVNRIYTPGSTVEFSAIGADTAGFPCEIPQDVTWRVAEGDEDIATLTQDGVAAAALTGKAGAEGSVTVEMVYEGKTVGSAEIEFHWPDALAFSGEELSLESGIETDLGLTAQYNYREVIFKDGDFTWEVTSDNPDQENQVIGEMGGPDSNIFVSNEKAVNAQGHIKATLKANTEVFAEALVVVGQEPTIVWDFEDVYDEETQTTIPAEVYYDPEDPDSAFTAYGSNDWTNGTAEVSSDYVRGGEHSLRVYYDFRQSGNQSGNSGVYFGLKETTIIPNNPGKPTALGVWVYLPQDTPNFWFRAYIATYEDDGVTIKKADNVVNFTAQSTAEAAAQNIPYYEDTIPAGWHYFEGKLGSYTADGEFTPYPGPHYGLYQGSSFRIMYVPGLNLGDTVNGYMYIDNFMFIYGANTEDVDPPEITGVDLVDEEGMRTAVSAGGVVTIDSNYVLVDSVYTGNVTNQGKVISEIEYVGILDGNGYSTGRTNIYIDGNRVRISAVTPEGMTTRPLQVPNGTHTVMVVVADVAGNEARYSFTLVVKGDKDYETVFLEEEAPPYLNQDYLLDLYTTDIAQTQSISFEIRFGLSFTLEDVVSLLSEQFDVTWDQINVIENIYEITVTRKEGVEIAQTDETVALAQLSIPIPKDLLQGTAFTYQVQSSTVVLSEQTMDGNNQVINSISAQNSSIEIFAYYEFDIEPTLVGDQNGAVITVMHNGVAAGAGVSVYLDDALIGTTDENGQVTTNAFSAAAVVKTLRAEDANGNVSYSVTLYGMTPMPADAEPVFVAAKAVKDSETQQAISWLSNPLMAGEPVVRYAAKADYEAAGGTPEVLAEIAKTYQGTSQVLEFDGFVTAADNYATLVNSVLLTGLVKDTEYVYQAGDGSVWSDVKTFSTTLKNGDTNFFVIGDTQGSSAADQEAVAAIANLIGSSDIDYDFGVQTGDFVDNAGAYQQWADVLFSFSGGFGDIDMIHALGNHEYGSGMNVDAASAINMLPDQKYYSVTYGSVYVAVINYLYTSDASRAQEAAEWLIEDAKESDAVWKVLIMHQPPYYTNPTGGNSYVHEYIPAAVDEAGIDFVFSGHDHSYARTQPMTSGAVDSENGAVYIISGSTGEKSYEIFETESFNFAAATGDFTSVYLSVEATGTTFTVTAYNVVNGEAQIFDTYTMTKNNACASDGHDYYYDGGYLTCQACGYTYKMPEDYTGMVKDEDGVNVYFSNGVMQTGWIQFGPDQYYFMEDGRAADGTVKLYGTMEVPESEGCGEISFTFENGKKVGGATGWYGNWYYIDGVYQSGFIEVDGDFYYLWSSADQWYNYQLGEKVRGGNVRVTIDMGAWIDRVNLYFGDDGKLLGIVNDEDGNMIPGTFYYRESISAWMYMTFYVDENGDVQYDYYRGGDRNGGGWLYGNDVLPEIKGNTYYIQWDWLLLGDQTIGGVHYVFADEGESDPRTSENGKLLGRYYDVSFVNGDEAVSEVEVFEGETAAAPETPAAPAGNSIKSYVFAGWFAGDVQYTAELAITSEMTFEARFDVVYTEKYASLQAAAQALAAAETPAEQGAAVKAMREIYQSLTEAEIADAAAEGIDFTAYEQMLEKLYQVTFTVDGKEVLRAELYEGEAIAAPADPVKESENIVIDSYAFVGWYDGDTVLAAGAAAEKDVTYAARFEAVYTESFASVAEKLAALEAAETPADKHAAIDAAEEAVAALTAEELAAAQEVVSFELYEEMLAKVYEVSFTVEGKTVLNAELYEGETIAAPAEEPVKESDSSIASYTFSGWYDGETKYVSGMTASKDAVFAARFTMVYSGKYEALAKALNDLSNAGTPAQKREAVLAAQKAVEALTAEELADAQAEGLSFTLYYDCVAKLYEVKFTADGKTVASMTAYEGETVKAPEAPAAPAGNSVKTYAFSGWYSGETAYTQELQIAGDMTFEAVFKAEYSAEYLAMEKALAAVDAAEGGTLAAQYEALSQVQALLQEFSNEERADAEAEGLSFAAYEQMLAAYNGIASGAADDIAKAESAAAKFVAAAAALSMLAAAAAVLRFGR